MDAGAVPIEKLREEDFAPKWVLNGFPKSGLHWLGLMLLPMAQPQFEEHNLWNLPWFGTFRGNSWTNRQAPLHRVTYKCGRLQDRQYLKTHSAYSEHLERFLWYLGAAVVFIYRDFRDVAVSQAFHVISEDDERLAHPDKGIYQRLGSFEEVLEAVIGGAVGDDGVEYPGVMERWTYYAGWLDVEWVCKVRFEELVADAGAVALRMLRHGLGRVSLAFGLEPVIVEENLERMAGMMVQAGRQTQHSPTFRKGGTGDWRAHFTPKLRALFKETDRDGWLERLGYEEDVDW